MYQRKVLITGSAGFVGSHFAAWYERHGWLITAVDLKNQGRDAIDFFQQDDTYFDNVIHCAANVGGRVMIDGGPLWVAHNLAIDEAYFNWLQRARPGNAVYFSSSAVYPTYLQLENRRLTPLMEAYAGYAGQAEADSTYGWAKLSGELLAKHYSGPLTIVRPFSGYGPGQDGSYPMTAFVDRAKAGEDPFTLWGSPQSTRDWIHIDDVVAGTFHLMDLGARGPVNLCTGVATTFLELQQRVCRAAGYSPRVSVDDLAPAGCFNRVGDPRLLEKHGFVPRVDLDEGIRRAFA